MERKESKFMTWGQKNEATMVHFVAWTLMCSTDDGKEAYGPILNEYSKKILSLLLFGRKDIDKIDNYSIKGIKIWREWDRTDILAEIYLENKTTEKEDKYVLFIELKAYGHTNEYQLGKYKESCSRYDYEGKDFKAIFVLLGAWNDAVPDEDKKICEKYKFNPYTFQDILDDVFLKGKETFESSNNGLFDEFWTGVW